MKHKAAFLWALVGVICIVAAFCLIGYNEQVSLNGSKASRTVLEQLQDEIESYAAQSETTTTMENGILAEYVAQTETEPVELALDIDESEYIGIVTIPSLGIELPVHAEWNYPNLKTAPCRYSGTVAGKNLILAAHNYSAHFGKISSLNTGDTILFTEANGKVHTYSVVQSELIYGYNSEEMLEHDDDWDITLFTCTWSGVNRVTVRAIEIE